MVEVEAGFTETRDYLSSRNNSEKNRDQFQYLFLSRLLIGSGAALIAFIGFAITQTTSEDSSSYFVICAIFAMFSSFVSAIFANIYAAHGYRERVFQNNCESNAQNYLQSANRMIKERKILPRIEAIVVPTLKNTIPDFDMQIEYKNYTKRVDELAEKYYRTGLDSLKHKKSSADSFNYVDRATVVSYVSMIVSFLMIIFSLLGSL